MSNSTNSKCVKLFYERKINLFPSDNGEGHEETQQCNHNRVPVP